MKAKKERILRHVYGYQVANPTFLPSTISIGNKEDCEFKIKVGKVWVVGASPFTHKGEKDLTYYDDIIPKEAQTH